jgi:hypothetical protein
MKRLRRIGLARAFSVIAFAAAGVTPAIHAQIPHPLISRQAGLTRRSALIARADTADKHSLKPLIIGAALGAAVGLYFGELAQGSCEHPGCTERYEAAPYLGLAGGAIVGALAGELFAHLPPAGPR